MTLHGSVFLICSEFLESLLHGAGDSTLIVLCGDEKEEEDNLSLPLKHFGMGVGIATSH